MPKMPTPRMLARTLFTLRHTRAELGLDVLGKNIDISDSHLNRLERRQATVHYEHLEKYQLFFGVPNGIVLAISHVAAMARDIAVHRACGAASRYNTEKKKLKLMARYLRNLADRIDPPSNLNGSAPDVAVPLTSYPDLTDEPATWDGLLLDLILSTQRGLNPNKPTVFRDLERLNEVIELTRRR